MPTQIKEHPIIFNSAMVQAILNGSKSQSRRVIKPQPIPTGHSNDFAWKQRIRDLEGLLSDCPYGQAGDRLWVRETFKYIDFCLADMGELHPRVKIEYKAAGIQEWVRGDYHAQISIPDKWRPSIFMPRWASRINLEITEIRVERLQEITPEETYKEGVEWPPLFKDLWDSLYAKRGYGWEANCWVWVLTFKKLD